MDERVHYVIRTNTDICIKLYMSKIRGDFFRSEVNRVGTVHLTVCDYRNSQTPETPEKSKRVADPTPRFPSKELWLSYSPQEHKNKTKYGLHTNM